MSVEKTRYGSWQVRWRDDTGRQRARTFKRKVDAESVHQKILAAQRERRVSEAIEGAISWNDHRAFSVNGIDPRGCYVYCLWGDNPDRPLYVGQSSNIFRRLGDHLSGRTFGLDRAVKKVTLQRCDDVGEMMLLEAQLISRYQPSLNRRGRMVS